MYEEPSESLRSFDWVFLSGASQIDLTIVSEAHNYI